MARMVVIWTLVAMISKIAYSPNPLLACSSMSWVWDSSMAWMAFRCSGRHCNLFDFAVASFFSCRRRPDDLWV